MIFRCYIMGDEPIVIEQFFYGFEGVIMSSIMGSQNIMGSDYGSNISVFAILQRKLPVWSVPKQNKVRPYLNRVYSSLSPLNYLWQSNWVFNYCHTWRGSAQMGLRIYSRLLDGNVSDSLFI